MQPDRRRSWSYPHRTRFPHGSRSGALLPSVAVEHQTRVDDADHANDHEDCDWIHEESPLGLKTALSHLVIVLLMAHENDALKNRQIISGSMGCLDDQNSATVWRYMRQVGPRIWGQKI
jgi:hypothetical protein